MMSSSDNLPVPGRLRTASIAFDLQLGMEIVVEARATAGRLDAVN